MGQQQLLLLVLGVVIVGLSVVVGIQAFGENQKKANADALVNDAVRIAADAQAWKLKPAAFGGGAESTWADVTLSKLGVDSTNVNGKFTVSGTTSSLLITAKSAATSGVDNTVEVTVTGTKASDITTKINES